MIQRLSTALLAMLLWSTATAFAQSLRGSSASLDQQNRVARAHDYTYIDTPTQLRRFVDNGYLVAIRGNANYELAAVSYPYGRPEVKLFVERLSAQYRAACGERLVVTSLTRPRNQQPANASPRSVHPTGMAVDLRIPQKSSCRSWLERTLLSLEGSGVLDATREQNPPHYHVALFPQQYAAYVARLEGRTRVASTSSSAAAASTGTTQTAAAQSTQASASQTHRVARGESLWTIARKYGTTVAAIQRANGLSSTRINAGQRLTIPVEAESSTAVAAMTYEVNPGDTLWTIAQRHGTTIAELRRTNGLTSSRIYAGQVLQVPVSR